MSVLQIADAPNHLPPSIRPLPARGTEDLEKKQSPGVAWRAEHEQSKRVQHETEWRQERSTVELRDQCLLGF